MRARRFRSVALAAALAGTVLGLAACGSDDDKSSSTAAASAATVASTPTTGSTDSSAVDTTEAPDTAVDTMAPATSDPVSGDPVSSDPASTGPDATGPDASDPDTTEPATTVAATTVPDAISEIAGVAPLDVTVAGADPTRPLFSWAAPAGAASYQLVQTADGAPLWAWTGEESQVALGGTERPADVEGPTLAAPARVRVYALDASANLVAVSTWVPVPSA